MATSITGFVLIKDDIQFVNTDGTVGESMQIPTPDGGGVVDSDVWAIPVNDGVFSGWQLLPYNPTNTVEATLPTPQSVACTKLSSNKTSDWYVVVGTSAQYVTAANGGTALPTAYPFVIHTLPKLAVCQTINSQDANGNYIATIGVPSLTVGGKFYPFGYLNGVALTQASTSGYADVTSLLSFLNSGTWATVGTWTATLDGLTLIATQASGTGTDVFCGNLIVINPSA